MAFSDSLNGDELCLCGSGKYYQSCCEPFHKCSEYPETAEQLMRSRYVAFAKKLKAYLLKTWHSTTQPETLVFESNLTWYKLVINSKKRGRKKDKEGWVTFTAYYSANLEACDFKEKSYFVRDEDHHWCYVDGDIKS
ncbi:MAG: SEC-C motif domain protein [Thiomicrorhabdus sp.]|nr:MAG: SEC-C motif domain protein [Thiomicrorhabdus sp.]